MPQDTDPRDQRKIDWLNDVTGQIAFSEENLADLNDRRAGQAVIASLDSKKAEIRDLMRATEFTVKTSQGGTKKMQLLSEDGDYRQEIDTVHHGPALLNDVPNAVALMAAFDEILKVERELKKNPYYAVPEPDYTEVPILDLDGLTGEELEAALDRIEAARLQREREMRAYALEKAEADKHLAEDLWHPLVREGVIPENLVPQQHSSIAQLFAASSEKYDARLEAYARDLTKNDILKEKFDLGFKVAGSTLKLFGGANALTSEISSLKGDTGAVETTAEIAEFVEYFETGLALSEAFSTAALTDKDYTVVGFALADAVFEQISGDMDPLAAQVVGSCLTNGARLVDVSKKVKAGEYEDGFVSLVEGVAGEMEKYDPQGKNGLMGQIARQMVMSVHSATAVKKIAVVAADPASKPSDVMDAMLAAANQVGHQAGADVPANALEAFSDGFSALNELGHEIDGYNDVVDGKFTLQELEAMRDARAAILERQKAADNRGAQLALDAAEARREADEAQFAVLLRTGLAAPQDDEDEVDLQEYLRAENIETILAIQARNDAVFKMCGMIASKGIGFVKTLFPPAALAEAAMTLSLTIKDAVEKAEELIVWRENVEDALTAHSAVADAMLNRKGLQTKQTMLAGIQVALDAAKVVAEVLALTPAAPAAPIVKASIDVAEAAIELGDLIGTEAQLAAAWKIYQRAKDNPEDRYEARKAMRENPTLAKYAMAYASLQGDPIAVEGMRRCGLSKVTLANPETNVDKVVTYLETKYPDDPVLLRAVPVPDKWYPGPITLTPRCWMTFYHAATSTADLADTDDVSGIAGALALIAEAEEEFDAALEQAVEDAKVITLAESAENPVELNRQDYAPLVSACLRLQDQLRAYSPKSASDGTPHASMAKFADALAAKSEQKVASVNAILKEKPWVTFYKSAKPSPTELAEQAVKSGEIDDPTRDTEETETRSELV
ncbi:MAG: hypothetical protein AAF646_02860 [Pseudomonadota bacterium]